MYSPCTLLCNPPRRSNAEITANFVRETGETNAIVGIVLGLATFNRTGQLRCAQDIGLTFEEALHLAHRLLALIGETGFHTGKPEKES